MLTPSPAVADLRDTLRYVPTLAEIAAQCAEIRRGWSEEETRKRWRRMLPAGWLPPLLHVAVNRHPR